MTHRGWDSRWLAPLALALLASTPALAAIKELKEVRAQLKAPAYTAEERQLLAEQAHFALSQLFVHRELKIADFGAEHDPVPRLAALAEAAGDLSNAEFHERLARTFMDLHDLHTNYMPPAPIGCGVAFVPLAFQSVQDAGQTIVVVSRKLAVRPDLTAGIEPGMQLVAVDGVPVEQAIAANLHASGGANPAAMRLRSIEMLSMIDPGSQQLPGDTLTLTLRKGTSESTKTIPWLASVDETCLTAESLPVRRPLPLGTRMIMAQDEYKKRFNEIFGQPSHPAVEEREAGEPWREVFDYATLTTPAGKLGYLKLKTFYWESEELDVGTVTEAFRRALEEGMPDAVGLVVDVRGNPGGLIVFAEKLIQLFAPRGVEPTTVRLLANDLNAEIFVRANGQDNRWSTAVRDAVDAGKTYTTPMAITPPAEANAIGQAWFKPVVVLTDAGCYSACDLFAAGMQDNGAARIIGLHETTGAGGANVMEYDTFRAIFAGAADNPFKPLPHGQNFRVSWRGTLRAGTSAGVLLEDRGVVSDRIVPLTRADVGGESRDLMKAIHTILDDLRPSYASDLAPKRGGSVLVANGAPAIWKEKVRGVDELVVEKDGVPLATIPVDDSDTPATIEVGVPSIAGAWTDARLTLVGKRAGTPVLRVVREIRWRGAYAAVPAAGLDLAFDGALAPMRTVDLRGGAGSGWKIANGKLRVGAGPNYGNGVLTRAFLPLALGGKAAKITLDIAVDAEDLCDSLRIYALNPDTAARVDLFAGSSLPATTGGTVRIPAGWQRADLVFEFESDENWSMTGPTIDNLRVKLQ